MSKQVAVELTENQNWLQMATKRLEAVKRDHPGNHEITRLEGAVVEIKSRMTLDEIDTYHARTTKELTPLQIRDRALAEAKAMAENRDKPSI
jgi:AAA15 family ATPase/GTPase